MRGHVNEVAGERHERFEARRARQRVLGPGRRFERVDVVMVGADVKGIAAQHGFENRDERFCALLRLAVVRPELPRVQIHQALGVQRGRVEIVWILARQIAHGVSVFHG